MSIKKSLMALAAMAIAMMGFASTALAATDGVVRDVTGTGAIAENTELNFKGAAKFVNENNEGLECHVTSVVKATGAAGTTGQVKSFSPITNKCTGSGVFSGCTLSADQTTNLPYNVTATPTDFDVTGTIVIDNTFTGCIVESAKLTFSEITLKPIGTGTRTITGGNNPGKMGTTAESGTAIRHSQTTGADRGDPIVGVELSGTGIAHVEVFGFDTTENITASGELELATASERCTYYLSTD